MPDTWLLLNMNRSRRLYTSPTTQIDPASLNLQMFNDTHTCILRAYVEA